MKYLMLTALIALVSCSQTHKLPVSTTPQIEPEAYAVVEGTEALGLENGLYPDALQALSDGRALIGIRGDNALGVGRLTVGGKIDPSFGVNGLNIRPQAANTYQLALEVLPGGTIAQAFYRRNFNSTWDYGVTRFSADGAFMSAVEIALPEYSYSIGKRMLTDGTLVVAVSENRNNFALTILRFKMDGTIQVVRSMDKALSNNAVILADGNIYTPISKREGGNWTIKLERFSADGVKDAAVLNYSIPVPSEVSVGRIHLMPNGKFLVHAANKTGEQNQLYLAQFRADGNADLSFADNGLKVMAPEIPSNSTIFVLKSGKILVIGRKEISPNKSHMTFQRFLANGSLDTRLDASGKIDFSPEGKQTHLNGVTELANGRLFVAFLLEAEGYSVARIK